MDTTIVQAESPIVNPTWARNDVFLKEYMGFRIYVTQDGKFATKLPGRDPLKRASLVDVQKEIEKLGKPVPVMSVHGPWRGFDVDVPFSYRMKESSITEVKTSTTSYYGGRSVEPYITRVRTADGEWVDKQKEDILYFYDPVLMERYNALGKEETKELTVVAEKAKEIAEEIQERYTEKREALLSGLTVLTRESFKEAQKP